MFFYLLRDIKLLTGWLSQSTWLYAEFSDKAPKVPETGL